MGGALAFSFSQIALEKLTLVMNEAQKGAGIYAENSNITLNNIMFIENKATIKGSSLYVLKTMGSSFYFFIATYIRGLNDLNNNIYISNYDSVEINSSELSQSNIKIVPGLYMAQAILIEDSLNVNLRSIKIVGFNGGSPVIINNFKQKGGSEIIISEALIKNCHSVDSGGAIQLTGSFRATLSNSNFSNTSSAGSGGAIAALCPGVSCELRIDNCIFNHTTAEQYAAILYKFNANATISKNNIFIDNHANGGSLTAGNPSKLFLLEDFPLGAVEAVKKIKELGMNQSTIRTQIDNVGSGQPINLIGILTDEDLNPSIFQKSGKVKIMTDDNSTFFDPNDCQLDNGFFIFRHLTAISAPGKAIEVNFIFEDAIFNKSVRKSINMTFRKCLKGEILSGITCQKCPPGYFSLDPDPIKNNIFLCSLCPVEATCPGGSFILPLEGFWRKDANHSFIAKCRVERACSGGGKINETSFSPICMHGYKGNLCSFCEDGFGLNAYKHCVDCFESYHYLKFFFLALASLLFIYYQTEQSSNFDENTGTKRAMMKIIVDHMSYVSFISSFKINWSYLAISIIDAGDHYITVVPREMFVFNCFISRTTKATPDELIKLNTLIISLSPFLYSVMGLLMMLLIKFIKKGLMFLIKKIKESKTRPTAVKSTSDILMSSLQIQVESSKSFGLSESNLEANKSERKIFLYKVLVMNIIIFYNFHSRLIMNALSLWSCVKLDESDDTFMDWNPNIRCWSQDHWMLIVTFSLFNILIWGLILPLGLFFLIKNKRNNVIKNTRLYDVIRFLVLDYNQKFYFWDLFSYLSKLTIMFMNVLINSLETSTQGGIIIFFFVLLFLIQEWLKPYNYEIANNLKTLSFISTITGIGFAIMASNKENDPDEEVAFIFLSIISSSSFFIFWGWYFLKQKKKIIVLHFKKLKSFRKKKNPQSEVEMQKSSSARENITSLARIDNEIIKSSVKDTQI